VPVEEDIRSRSIDWYLGRRLPALSGPVPRQRTARPTISTTAAACRIASRASSTCPMRHLALPTPTWAVRAKGDISTCRLAGVRRCPCIGKA